MTERVVRSLEQAIERRPTASTVAGGLFTSASSVFVALAAVSTGTVAFFRFVLAVPLLLPLALAGGLAGGATGADPTQGALLACAAALCYAGFLLLLRQAGDSGTAFANVLGLTIGGALVSAIVAPLWHGLDLTPSAESFGWIVGVTLSSQVIAYVLIGPALPRLSPSAGAAVLLIQPVGSVALGALALDERPSALQLAGCGLVLAAVYAATLAESRKERSATGDPGTERGRRMIARHPRPDAGHPRRPALRARS